MQLPPAPVLLLALFVVLFAVFGRHRTTRPRRLADIGGFMSSSYAADVDGGDAADADRGDVAKGVLAPARAGSPAS